MNTKAQTPADAFSSAPYDHIPLHPVSSSQLKSVGYDARRNILAAQFLHGAQAVYHYPNVTPELHAAFAASDSKGAFFGQHIKALPFEKYPVNVLTELPAPVPTALAAAIAIAAELHGREYNRLHVPADVVRKALDAGLVIVYGESDDMMAFEGAISETVYPSEGVPLFVDHLGLLQVWEQAQGHEDTAAEYLARKPNARSIEALWCHKGEDGKVFASWSYKTDIPHATFDIMEDGEIYCRGIVFALADLAKPAA